MAHGAATQSALFASFCAGCGRHSAEALYDQSDGVPHSFKDAVNWYRHAAAQGEPAAQEQLGQIYEEGTAEVPEKLGPCLQALLHQCHAGLEGGDSSRWAAPMNLRSELRRAAVRPSRGSRRQRLKAPHADSSSPPGSLALLTTLAFAVTLSATPSWLQSCALHCSRVIQPVSHSTLPLSECSGSRGRRSN